MLAHDRACLARAVERQRDDLEQVLRGVRVEHAERLACLILVRELLGHRREVGLGLLERRLDVDNREPPEAQGDSIFGVSKHAAVIRAAVPDAIRHAAGQGLQLVLIFTREAEDADYSAHEEGILTENEARLAAAPA